MTSSFVLTVIGPDRPGLVELLAATIARHDASWVESRMAHLRGHFAGLLRVDVPADRAKALEEALRDLPGLRVLVESAGDALPAPSDAEAPPLTLELVGQDRPGIVRDVSRALAERGVNVEEFESECVSAPMSGELLFRARARLRLPAAVSPEALRSTLEQLADELMVDLTFE